MISCIALFRTSNKHRHLTDIWSTPWIRYFKSKKPTLTRTSISNLSQTKTIFRCLHSKSDDVVDADKFGGANSMVLYDSLSEKYRPLQLLEDNNIKEKLVCSKTKSTTQKGMAWYTCGPTVYDHAHLGHARTYINLDIIRRILAHLNHSRQDYHLTHPPIFIMNITDVDDKILQRADELGECPRQLAQRFERDFWDDMKSLNVLPPTIITRVTEHVHPSIIPYIQKILDNRMAYQEEDGIYFDVTAFENALGGKINKYGKLGAPTPTNSSSVLFKWKENNNNNDSSNNIQTTKHTQKRDPRDFVLWKSRKKGEEKISWNSPWGYGRPGWHIECSAMIESTMKLFNETHILHVHAGGVDLKFPHHTNEIAQAEAYHFSDVDGSDQLNEEKEWISHWVHMGHLHIQGMKMSKSLKNFITIKQLLSSSTSDNELIDEKVTNTKEDTYSNDSPADDFRLWCLGLSGNYRGNATYSKARLEEAKKIRGKIVRFLIDGENWIRNSSHTPLVPPGTWGADDIDFWKSINLYSVKCNEAMKGFASDSNGTDMNGAAILKAITLMSETGQNYISSTEIGSCPLEPIQQTLSTLRQNLSLVGFSDKTVKAGTDSQQLFKGNVLGGEIALVDELVKFRSTVRKITLNHLKAKEISRDKKMLLKVLDICDETRKYLPTIGVEIFDHKREEKLEKEKNEWRFCLPHKKN